jgi:hypothetical protein
VTLCATLDQKPIIRFGANSALTSALAALVEEKLLAFGEQVPSWPSNTAKERPVLLLLDRAFDMVSPFMHELTYQAMCQDLLEIDNDVYCFETENGKRDVLLNEKDILWPTLRHKHIADTSSHLINSFRQFIASNAAVKFKTSEVNTLSDMSKVLRAMPEFQELREKYALHISLANQCISEFGTQLLESICYLEQALATGTDKEYNPVKASEIARDITNTVKKGEVSVANKLRMMLLYIVTQNGLKQENIDSLSSTAGFGPAEAQTLEALKHFGFDIAKLKDKKKKSFLELLGVGKKPERAQYELSRYICPLKSLLQELCHNRLSTEAFPYLHPHEALSAPEGVKKTASLMPSAWESDTGNNNNAAPEGREMLVFVLGGMSYSECRAAYEVGQEQSRTVFVGSTAVCQPQEFVRQLQHLANDKPPPILRQERLANKDKIERHG